MREDKTPGRAGQKKQSISSMAKSQGFLPARKYISFRKNPGICQPKHEEGRIDARLREASLREASLREASLRLRGLEATRLLW